MAANPRIDGLRQRLSKEPGSRLFAQLAEELRKAGELDEAVRTCREGLQAHPNYPSARMTLGRALVDQGDLPAARVEFATVLKGAPDNILASRLLGECLEGMNDQAGALAQYKTTLLLAPGDSQLSERITVLEAGLLQGPDTAAPVDTTGGEAVAPPSSGPAPVAQEASPEPAPIPLVEAPEEFELESASAAVASRVPEPAPAPTEAAPASEPSAAVEQAAEAPVEEADFDADLEGPVGRTVPFQAPPVVEAVEAVAAAAPEPSTGTAPQAAVESPIPEAPPAPVAPEAPSEGASSETPRQRPRIAHLAPEHAAAAMEDLGGGSRTTPLTSATLGELYVAQGLKEKAIEVFGQLLEREPDNEAARGRLAELQREVAAEQGQEAGASGLEPRAARRAAIERTILRLEALMAQLKKKKG